MKTNLNTIVAFHFFSENFVSPEMICFMQNDENVDILEILC